MYIHNIVLRSSPISPPLFTETICDADPRPGRYSNNTDTSAVSHSFPASKLNNFNFNFFF